MTLSGTGDIARDNEVSIEVIYRAIKKLGLEPVARPGGAAVFTQEQRNQIEAQIQATASAGIGRARSVRKPRETASASN